MTDTNGNSSWGWRWCGICGHRLFGRAFAVCVKCREKSAGMEAIWLDMRKQK